MMRKILIALFAAVLAWPALAQAPAQTPAPAPGAAPAARTARAAAKPAAAATGKVDINAAAEPQLQALPGVGPARSKAIVANRPYDELGDLVKKKALSQGVFDKVKDQLALANINSSTAAQMEKTLPGIGDVRSKAIVAGRPYAGPQDLVAKGVLTQPQLDRIKDVIAF